MRTELPFGERRLHQRKSCAFEIVINDYTRIYSTLMRDLSLGGALLERPRAFEPRVGQELLLTIAFRKKAGSVIVKGEIVRSHFDRLAIAFVK